MSLHTTLTAVLLVLLAGQAQPGCQGRQGIRGRIVFESGNQMPGPGVERQPAEGVKRELLIYPLLKADALEGKQNGFYIEPAESPLETVTSDHEGNFQVALPPGEYSLLVREEGKLYANLFDGEGHIFPVEVKSGEMTEVEFKINYAAVY